MLVEVLDAAGKPLLRMPLERVRRQRLRHRAVAVCLRNGNGLVFLHKQPTTGGQEPAGQWNFSASTKVAAGESSYDAALRKLREELDITGLELYHAGAIKPCEITENAEVALFLTAKSATIPRMRGQEPWDGMFVDKEEFAALLRDFPYMMAPVLQLAGPYLFSQ